MAKKKIKISDCRYVASSDIFQGDPIWDELVEKDERFFNNNNLSLLSKDALKAALRDTDIEEDSPTYKRLEALPEDVYIDMESGGG